MRMQTETNDILLLGLLAIALIVVIALVEGVSKLIHPLFYSSFTLSTT